MKIVVISDTHLPRMAKQLPNKLVDELEIADLIIHAGDWQTLDVYDTLAKYTEVVGVYGNVDSEQVRAKFKEKEIIQAGSFTLGVTHGHGTKGTTDERARAMFAHDDVDCIIFGHSHIPVKKYVKDVLLFNPGSATDKRRQPRYSFGVITISDQLHATHVYYDNKT